ncbi:dCMP deaminase family protein [Methylomonas methanica]|uniref:dCMP deaminase family protein n=1 Tax=Methylomonas methanica TaxID=421 RepID=UPI003CC7D7BC
MQKWDERFCELAEYISEWSKDPNAKVGAVIFSKKGGNISIGYNGFPMGVEDSAERLTDKDIKLELVVHAEVNALIAAGDRAQGSTIYVWGKPICSRCAGPIIQAGELPRISRRLQPLREWSNERENIKPIFNGNPRTSHSHGARTSRRISVGMGGDSVDFS